MKTVSFSLSLTLLLERAFFLFFVSRSFFSTSTKKNSTPNRRRRRRLILMRHAPSADAAPASSSSSRGDHDRPLTVAGVAAAKACARALLAAGWLPDLVVASDALRSRQTLEAMGEAVADFKRVKVKFAGALYAAAALDGDDHTARALAETLEEALACSSSSAGEEGGASSAASAAEREEERRETGKGASSSSSSGSPTTVLAVGHNKVRLVLFFFVLWPPLWKCFRKE